MLIEDVTVKSESDRWVILELYKSTIIVLPRSAFVEGLKRGKAWRRAAMLRARVSGAMTVDGSGGPDGGCPREQGDVQ